MTKASLIENPELHNALLRLDLESVQQACTKHPGAFGVQSKRRKDYPLEDALSFTLLNIEQSLADQTSRNRKNIIKQRLVKAEKIAQFLIEQGSPLKVSSHLNPLSLVFRYQMGNIFNLMLRTDFDFMSFYLEQGLWPYQLFSWLKKKPQEATLLFNTQRFQDDAFLSEPSGSQSSLLIFAISVDLHGQALVNVAQKYPLLDSEIERNGGVYGNSIFFRSKKSLETFYQQQYPLTEIEKESVFPWMMLHLPLSFQEANKWIPRLISLGANINGKNAKGLGAVHLCAAHGSNPRGEKQIQNVMLWLDILAKNGADLTMPDSQGKSCAEYYQGPESARKTLDGYCRSRQEKNLLLQSSDPAARPTKTKQRL